MTLNNAKMISLAEIKKRANSKEKFCQMFSHMGKIIFNHLGLYLPPNSCYDFAFCVKVMSRKKKISSF